MSFLATSTNPVTLHLIADWRLITFIGAIATLVTVLFGLLPALRVSIVDPTAAMRHASRGLTLDRHRTRFQRGLLVAQIAVSLVLIVSALLFVQTFRNLAAVDAGFERHGTISVSFVDRASQDLPRGQNIAFQQRMTADIRSVRGVAAAASSTHVPLRDRRGLISFVSWVSRETNARHRASRTLAQATSTH